MPQPSGAVHSIWWLGFFFDLFSHSGLRAFFTSDFANCTTNYAPTIRCCPQHLMVGVIFFFLTCSPILDLGHFSQVILPIVLLIMPQPSGAVNSIWWLVVFFLTFSPILDLGHFSQVILPIVLQIMPNHQVLFTASDGWWFFFYLFSHSGLRAFFTSDFANCTKLCLPLKITPTIRCCSQHLMVGVFFYLFSHSGLRAFFTSDFANCTTNYAPAQK